jgi:hypothetical protein
MSAEGGADSIRAAACVYASSAAAHFGGAPG